MGRRQRNKQGPPVPLEPVQKPMNARRRKTLKKRQENEAKRKRAQSADDETNGKQKRQKVEKKNQKKDESEAESDDAEGFLEANGTTDLWDDAEPASDDEQPMDDEFDMDDLGSDNNIFPKADTDFLGSDDDEEQAVAEVDGLENGDIDEDEDEDEDEVRMVYIPGR